MLFSPFLKKILPKKIIVASAGNHAQGIGYAAKLLGKESQTIICVPGNTPQTKIDAIRRYGVKLEIIGEIYDDAENYAIQKAKDENLLFISPYNHPDIIAGQGTVGLEILQQAESLDYILVPLSGGGLLAGILVAMKELKPELKIFGVQSEACPVMVESLKQGEIVDVPMSHSIAEGLHGGVEKGSITFPILQHYIEDVLLVSEQEIGDAIVDLIREHHQICEGAGAVGLAAIGRYKELFIQKTGVVVISGGNINYDLLQSLICSRKEN